MPSKPLRAVAPGEALPQAERALSVGEAAALGDQRALLVATRTRIAKTVDNPSCPARDLAALTKRLTDIAKEIEAFDAKARQEAREDVAAADEAWDAEAL